MATKRKISVRKILQLFTTVVVSVCCIIAMVSASDIESNQPVASIAIHIQNHKKYHFIEQNEIMDLAINKRDVDIYHTPIARLDVHAIEKTIMADPWVAYAQVFIDNERVLHLYVTQRIPIARIFEQDGSSYYMDTTLSKMPLSSSTVYYTTVVTNVPMLGTDSCSKEMKREIALLVRKLQADSFWNAQISHVVIDSDNSFQLIPVLGDQRIMVGNMDRVDEKLHNLFAFYKNVLNRIGWDKYETLDLRFKDQVIASPSLPYKGPVDRAVDKMNWINSIVETEARKEGVDSVKAEAKESLLAANKDKAADKKAGKDSKDKNHKEDGKKVAAKPEKVKEVGKKAPEKGKPQAAADKGKNVNAKPAKEPAVKDTKLVKATATKESKPAKEAQSKDVHPTPKTSEKDSKAHDTKQKDVKEKAPEPKADKKEKKEDKKDDKKKNDPKEQAGAKAKEVKQGEPKYVYPENK